jgi:hypothetical protein
MTEPLLGRSWPGKAMMLVIVLLVAVAAAACSGGSSSSAAPGPRADSGALAYAKCRRAHGIADFPDPNAQGGFSAPCVASRTSADAARHPAIQLAGPTAGSELAAASPGL